MGNNVASFPAQFKDYDSNNIGKKSGGGDGGIIAKVKIESSQVTDVNPTTVQLTPEQFDAVQSSWFIEIDATDLGHLNSAIFIKHYVNDGRIRLIQDFVYVDLFEYNGHMLNVIDIYPETNTAYVYMFTTD